MDIKTVFIDNDDDSRTDEVTALIAVAIARFTTAIAPVDSGTDVRVYADVENEEARRC